MTPEIEKRIKAVQAGRIPAGYKRTKVGIVPKEWGEVRFHDMFSRVVRKNKEGNTNVLTISAQYGLINQNDFFNKTVASDDKSNYYLMKKGEFAYNKSYSNGYPFGALKRLDFYDKGVVSPLYICFAANENNKCPDFYVHYFEAGLMNGEIQAFAQEGARNHGLLNISVDDFFNSNLLNPPLSEQKKIAEILATQDRVIELKEKLIAEKQSQKKWFIQLMTTGKKRLPNFNGKWTKISLSSVADIVTDCINPSDFQNEKFEVYSLPAFDNGKEPEILQGSEISTSKFLIRKDMVLFNKLNVRQKRVWLVSGDSEYKTISSTEFLPIVVKDIDNVFLTYLLLNDSITSYLKKKSSGTSNSQKRILPKDLMAMKVKVPSLPEQKAIADVLSAADEEISLLQKDLEQEKLKKKSLMQLLLTGLVRVKV